MTSPALNAAMINLKMQREEKMAKASAIANALVDGKEASITLTAEMIERLLEQRAPDGSVVLRIHLE